MCEHHQKFKENKTKGKWKKYKMNITDWFYNKFNNNYIKCKQHLLGLGMIEEEKERERETFG